MLQFFRSQRKKENSSFSFCTPSTECFLQPVSFRGCQTLKNIVSISCLNLQYLNICINFKTNIIGYISLHTVGLFKS